MERSTIQELGEQIARLEADNTRLKEDVAFFEAATADRPSTAAKDAGRHRHPPFPGRAGSRRATRRAFASC